MSDNDDAITKPIQKKEKKPMSDEAKAKLAKAREVVAANRAAKKAELEAAKEIVRAKAAKPVVEEAPSAPKTKSTDGASLRSGKKAAPAVIVQEEDSDDDAPPVVIIKKKKPKKPQVVYESASETDEDEPAPQPTPRATKSQQHKATKQPFGKVAGASEAPAVRYYFA